mgnify:CR=1 FL=1
MKQVKIKLPLRMLTLASGLLLTASSFAQSNAIKGQVKDASGEPVMGATITVNGKAVGITDMDGNFSVDAAPGTKLTFTYLGMTPKTVQASKNMIITMIDDSKSLNEVVVIGYGRAKKNDLTGSVTAIKPDEMSKGITSSASDMLVGKIAGVDVQTAGGQPGSGAQIRIRGGASLNASNDPLYVIDGLAIDNNTNKGMSNVLAMINPNDIESFTVLKDASATAIYGSRASNGVIIITTKKGRAGQRPTVTYNGDITISTIQKKYEVMNASEYKQALTSLGKDISSLGLGDADTDWQDEIFRTSVSTNHSLSIQGGLKDMPYRIGLGFEDNNGILKNSWMKRFYTSVNLAPSFLNKHLNFNFTAKYMFEKNRYVDDSSAINNALKMDPTQPVYGDGDKYKFFGGYFQYAQDRSTSISDPNWMYLPATNVPVNPVAILDQNKHIAKAHDISSNLEVDYKIHGFEDLNLHAAIGAHYVDGKQNDNISKYSVELNNNYFGWYGTNHAYKYNIEGKAYAEYAHKFGVHDIDIMAGAEQSHYHSTGYNFGSGIDEYLRDNNPQMVDGEWNYVHSPQYMKNTLGKSHNSLVSYFGRLNYNLLDRYLLTATYRADGSSRFRNGKKWGYFPAAAFAWKINNEPFMKNVTWIDELKLRLGWGKTGQQDVGKDFYYTPAYTVGNPYAQYPFGDTYYETLRPGAYNADLTWEKTTTYNAGLDFTALNGRFGVNVEGYYRKTTDLLSEVDIAGGTNFSNRLLKNIGSLENYGVELAFDVKPIVTKDFMWDVTYNVGWNHNEVTELDAGQHDYVWVPGKTATRGNNSTNLMINKVGEPANSFYVWQQVYDENGKPIEGLYVDRNADGKIDEDDRYCYKSPAPDVIMGLTTKFIYKNWDFSAAFHASIGNYVYYDFLSDKANLSLIWEKGAFTNTTADAVNLGFWGKTINQTQQSDYFVRNASYLKCTNMTLGYSFPALIKAGSEKICSGRIYFTVQNPFIITKYKGIDPEIQGGIDNGRYPRPISFQLGLNLNF